MQSLTWFTINLLLGHRNTQHQTIISMFFSVSFFHFHTYCFHPDWMLNVSEWTLFFVCWNNKPNILEFGIEWHHTLCRNCYNYNGLPYPKPGHKSRVFGLKLHMFLVHRWLPIHFNDAILVVNHIEFDTSMDITIQFVIK